MINKYIGKYKTKLLKFQIKYFNFSDQNFKYVAIVAVATLKRTVSII